MKICPNCSRTYSDETLSFCLEDGALLSASYNPQETNAPTFLINAVDMPTVVNLPRPTQQTQKAGVSWIIYLIGLIISTCGEIIFFYLLYNQYFTALSEFHKKIAMSFDNIEIGYMFASLVIAIPYNVIYYSLLTFLLGFIWSRARWKWGIVAILPGIGFIVYYYIINLLESAFPPLSYYVRIALTFSLYFGIACLFSFIGSYLSQKIFNKPTA